MNTMIKILWIFWFQLQLLTIIRIIICLPWAMGRLNALYAWLLHLSTFFFTIIVRGWKNLTSVHQLWPRFGWWWWWADNKTFPIFPTNFDNVHFIYGQLLSYYLWYQHIFIHKFQTNRYNSVWNHKIGELLC